MSFSSRKGWLVLVLALALAGCNTAFRNSVAGSVVAGGVLLVLGLLIQPLGSIFLTYLRRDVLHGNYGKEVRRLATDEVPEKFLWNRLYDLDKAGIKDCASVVKALENTAETYVENRKKFRDYHARLPRFERQVNRIGRFLERARFSKITPCFDKLDRKA